MYIWLENLKYNILNFKTTYYNLIFPIQLRDTYLSLKLAYELTINNIKTSFICITNSNSSSPTLIIPLEDTPISFQPRSFLIILRERINQYGHGLRITSFQPSQAFIIGLEMGWSTKKKKYRSHICLMVHRRIMNYGSSAILLTLFVVLIVHVWGKFLQVCRSCWKAHII